MSNFKQTAEKWAEEELSKQPKVSHEEINYQLQEFMLLGSLLYDDKGNWIPQLNVNQSFEVKPVEIKDDKSINYESKM